MAANVSSNIDVNSTDADWRCMRQTSVLHQNLLAPHSSLALSFADSVRVLDSFSFSPLLSFGLSLADFLPDHPRHITTGEF
jgi:hypothetical protein